jgi:hypothetical protein
MKSEPMDRFRRYEEDFLNSSRIISRGLKQLDSCQGNVDSVLSISAEIDGELMETEAYLRAMDTEFRSMVATDKKNAGGKVTDYKEEYQQIVVNFRNAKNKAESIALKSGSANREKMLTSNQRLDNGTAGLEKSRQLIAESENIGNKISGDLENQKETLVDAKGKVQETKQFTTDARGILRMMGRRNVYHKLIMITIILVLFGAICVTFYYGIIDSKK